MNLLAEGGLESPIQPQTPQIYITIHGHFYQPPRENPYLDVIENQPGAAPAHDWNERIDQECYRPNAFARILNSKGEVLRVVNNFEYLSFNIGPTLMSWLERYDPQTYGRIVEADRNSSRRLGGHGNAIAQVYNHIIMPLANQRDRLTQIRWGKADFQHRFGRAPEGMWLAETAVDYPTLVDLVTEGMKFLVLAPSQAQGCRPLPTSSHSQPDWQQVGGGQIDPTRPYRCFIDPESSPHRRYLDIFFYDGPISRDMGFSNLLQSSQYLVGRLGQAIQGDHRLAQLLSVATDGETFGHHKKGAEKCLAYAFVEEFPRHNWQVTNFAHYLSLYPPEWEVQIKPVTAWSCAHGVGRWQEDCGCGGEGSLWQQKWRRPLRQALDWLRDRLIKVFDQEGGVLLRDPWAARDEYIQVILNRSGPVVEQFLFNHQHHPLTPSEQVDALRLLEMQRHALLMYTSCGWFFEELSRPEGVQILRYAARALELAGDVAGVQLEDAFIRRLALAPSNVEQFGNGAEVYRQLVLPTPVSLEEIAAHYAISTLFNDYPSEQPVYCYLAHRLDHQVQHLGNLSLAIGQVRITSQVTQESQHLVFAVLHLGGWDCHCCIQPFAGRRAYGRLKESLFSSLVSARVAHTVGLMNSWFAAVPQVYGLQNLLGEERGRIMEQLSQATLDRLAELYKQAYRDNYGLLMAFHRENLPVPRELQTAAEVALTQQLLAVLASLQEQVAAGKGLGPWDPMINLVSQALQMRCDLGTPRVCKAWTALVHQSLEHLLNHGDWVRESTNLHQLLYFSRQLHLNLSLEPAQELYYDYLAQLHTKGEHSPHGVQILDLAKELALDIHQWSHLAT